MHFLTVKDAASRLGCSSNLVYLLCSERQLIHHRLGTGRGTIRISEEDLRAFVDTCRVSTNPSLVNLRHIRRSAGEP